MAKQALLHFKNVKKSFSGNVVLSGVDFEIFPGQIVALAGENGAGKSTLMNILFGMNVIQETGGYEGEIIFEGKPVKVQSPEDAMALGIGMVHQEFMLLPGFTVARNIKLNRENVRPNLVSRVAGKRFELLDNPRIVEEASGALHKLGMEINPEVTVDKLPVGHMQFVEIAREIDKSNLKLLVLDEPTAVLTESEAERFLKCIRQVADEGIAVIVISHRLDEVMTLADSVVILRDGQMVFDEKTKNTSKNQIAELMVGRKLEDQYPHLDKAPGTVRLKVDNLCGPGVENVTFSLRQGEILGVAGLMGAGRTELMKVLYGALPRTGGHVTLDGHEVVTRSPQDGLANGIVYISEDRKRDGLVLGMSVKENMSLTALRYFSRSGGSLKHKDEQLAVSDFIRLFNVKTPSMDQAIGLLSGGNQQKVAIARGLMTRPKVLILDEPTRGVDVGAKKEIYQLINQFKADGLSIILVSSEMPEVLGMSDRIMVMHEGHLGGEFTREQATQEVLMAAAVGKLNRLSQHEAQE